MKLGFVGVGRWSQKLAAAFRACGAEIVAYDRRAAEPVPIRGALSQILGYAHGQFHDLDGFGSYSPWREQLTDPRIDAIIAAAPPDITTEVAIACAAAGKPVMATKPLWDHPERITAPFYVDFWRLWSDAHRETKRAYLEAKKIPRVFNYVRKLTGSGPMRDFPGAFDYGPHVLAEVLDIYGEFPDWRVKFESDAKGERVFAGLGGPLSAHVEFGNGFDEPERVLGEADGVLYQEEGAVIGSQPKQAVIEAMCRAFMADVAEGFTDTRLLELSRESTRMIRRIREMAK